ncbi:iron-containing alcohol dehydrogenase [Salipaludibacillus sp. HK11]|uniref:iron-containing alcohol dehydrogenase n=1 Tax=Salipaludibacillus sp. HK11 TaxID=3394320 RepID=UPI0039FBB246
MYHLPSKNLLGKGCLNELGTEVQNFQFQKALIVTDKVLSDNGIVQKVIDQLLKVKVDYVIYDEVKPNPTTKQVHKGVDILKENDCDFILSIGGGSPQDCASAMSIIATNGGDVREYEGAHKSNVLGFPTIAVNTTAGTSAEITINYVITDEDRSVKMVCVDKNSLAILSVNDPELMIDKPASLTAATGMDTLTHAIEAIVTPGATVVTDATALQAVKLVFDHLPEAVENGTNIEAREQMVNASFLAGMAFSNAGLGYVHAMAHQLGGVYDLPHGVCNAMLLPIVERENAKRVPEKFRKIAKMLHMNIDGRSDTECAEFVIESIRQLSKKVMIPEKLSELGVTEVDLEILAKYSLEDACAPGNPFMPTKQETIDMFKEIL